VCYADTLIVDSFSVREVQIGNDSPLLRRSLTFIVFFLLLSDLFASPNANLGQPASLCTGKEIVLCSCNIWDKQCAVTRQQVAVLA
jgi:hypothetical protein